MNLKLIVLPQDSSNGHLMVVGLLGIEMSFKKNCVFIGLVLACAAAPSFAQNQPQNQQPNYNPIKQNPAEREKIRRTVQELAIGMSRTKDGAGGAWQDISSAPSFPLPLFRGNQTKFAGQASAYFQKLNPNCRQINIYTRDPAPNVYQFYAGNLPSSGFVLDNSVPRVVGKSGQAYLLKGESQTAFATVSISKKDDPSGPGALISIAVINKPPKAKK